MDWGKFADKAMRQLEKSNENMQKYKDRAAGYDDETIAKRYKNATSMSEKMGYMAELKERREYELSQKSDAEIQNAIRRGTTNELIIKEARRRGLL